MKKALCMTTPLVGAKAPPFTLSDQDGNMRNLKDYLGQFVVIYFYPKAMTPGCTTQACGIRDNWKTLTDKGVQVLGISPDAPKLLNKFKDTYVLPFDLLSDSEHTVAEAYGTWQEKSMYGKKYMGVMRDTFVLDPDGTIISVLQKATPKTHVDDILKVIDSHVGLSR